MVLEKETGVWKTEVAEAKPGDEYMYFVNGDKERRDPRGRQLSDEGKSVVHDPAAFDWDDTSPPRIELHDLVIYQMHPGTFFDPEPDDGRSATLRDAISKLDHLQELGVNCVLLMPVAEFAGEHSWGYNPSDPYCIERAYGGPDALREFVKEAHRRGIAVHVDVVHNHYGPGDLDLEVFDGYSGGENNRGIYFYEDEERGSTPWGPRPDFGRPEVRAFIADQIRMLFDEYRIDGLRWDSVVNIVRYNEGASENADGEKFVDEVSEMIRSEYPGKISIAEDAVGDNRFDASWEYAFHHAGADGESGVAPQLLRPAGETDVSDIAAHLQSDLGFSRVVYTENHDETGKLNGKHRIITDADENDPHSLMARRKHALAAVLTLTVPGVPLIFMGQELLESAEFHDSNPLDWSLGELSGHSTQLYRDLVRLRRNLDGQGSALQETRIRIMEEDREKQFLVYRRYLPGKPDDDLVIAINFSPNPVENLPLTLPRQGRWKVVLDTDDPKYGADFTGAGKRREEANGNVLPVSLAPFSAQIIGVEKR
jgi:1,4-alpha-glucan branching enzyme